jgi:hypothetical protein
MIKTTIFTRPNTGVAFPRIDSVELQDYVNATYRSFPVKLISKSQTVSEDLLTLTIIQQFVDEAAAAEFDNDPARSNFLAERNAYASANGITITVA